MIGKWSRRRFLQVSGAAVPTTWLASGCSGFMTPAAGSDAAALQKRIAGTVVVKGQESYEAWRKAMIWQLAKAERHPDMIVQVNSVEDVQEAVRYAADRDMKVTTRGGGHSMAASFLRDEGMLIDVSRLDGIEVDAGAKRAIAGPGVICRGLSEELEKYDLAFPGAHCGTVAISGYLLGGGVGLNTRAWSDGLSVFAVEAVDIVTPDGELRRASADENPDLFWAARGGGPGLFGVVTNFHLQCYDAPKVIWGTTYVLPFSEFRAVNEFIRDVAPTMDPNVETLWSIAPNPEVAEDRPAEERALIFLDVNAFAASENEGRQLLAPLTEHPIATRAIDAITERAGSFDSYYSDNEAGFPQTHWMGDSVWLDDPMDAYDILLEAIRENGAPRALPLMLLVGEHDEPDASASALGRYYFAYYMEWEDPADEQRSREFCLRTFNKLKTVAEGSYINEMDQEGRPEDIHLCYTPEAWKRLNALRAKWDPNGVFHGFYGIS